MNQATTIPPAKRRKRLDILAGQGFAVLSEEQRAEAQSLVQAEIDDWRDDICRRMQADVQSGRFTRRALAKMIGVHETYMGQVIAKSERLSERAIAVLSVAVPGYEDAYIELRRRADRLWLAEEPSGRANLPDDYARYEAYRAAHAALSRLLPAAMVQLSQAAEVVKDLGPADV